MLCTLSVCFAVEWCYSRGLLEDIFILPDSRLIIMIPMMNDAVSDYQEIALLLPIHACGKHNHMLPRPLMQPWISVALVYFLTLSPPWIYLWWLASCWEYFLSSYFWCHLQFLAWMLVSLPQIACSIYSWLGNLDHVCCSKDQSKMLSHQILLFIMASSFLGSIFTFIVYKLSFN